MNTLDGTAVAALVAAAFAAAIAVATLFAHLRLRRHHRALAAAQEHLQRQILAVAESARDELREVERQGRIAAADRFAAFEAAQERRARVRSALDEVLAAAALGRLGRHPAGVLLEHLEQVDRELRARGETKAS